MDSESELWPCNNSVSQHFVLENTTGATEAVRFTQGEQCLTMPDEDGNTPSGS
eukprot:SAG22_NODE_21160_length_259_cov_0.943750_1_plen_52_part_01